MNQPIGLTELCAKLSVDLTPSVLKLAEKVNDLFDGRLQCQIDPALPSPGRFDIIEGRPYVIARPDATEAVIAHELLHADLCGNGFVAPFLQIRFDDKDESLLKGVHAKLANALEHKMMFPRYKELDLDEEEFVGFKNENVEGVIRRIKNLREPRNVILRADIAILYVELCADYAFAHDSAIKLTQSLRNDLYRLYSVCQSLRTHIESTIVSSPAAYSTVFTESMQILGIDVVSVD